MNKNIKWAGIVVGLILVGMILGIAASPQGVSTVTSISTSTLTTTSTLTITSTLTTTIISTTSITTSTTSAPTTTTAQETYFKVGETAKYLGLEVTVVSATVTDRYTYYSDIFKRNMTVTASEGKKFVILFVEVRNVGSSSRYVGIGDCSLSDSNGYKYEPTYYLGSDEFSGQELYPNDRTKGVILFEIPKDSIGLKFRFNFGLLTPYLVTWILGE